MALFGKTGEKKGAKAGARMRHAHAVQMPGGKAHEVIKAPWLSEKALLGTERNVYVFAVSPRATSAQIAGAIKEIYGVAPKAVRIVNKEGKRKPLRGRRGLGRQASSRKAYITLNAGDSISLV